jgi:hypothetical protein
MHQNGRFNRLESDDDSFYISKYGSEPLGHTFHKGYIKCKLVHGRGYSVIVPDLLLLGRDGCLWLQPLAFYPNQLANRDGKITCAMAIDVSCGNRVFVEFTSNDFVARLSDSSELYLGALTEAF